MKTFQIVLLIAASFGTGFLLADGLAQAAPELQFTPQTAVVAAVESSGAESCADVEAAAFHSQPDIGAVVPEGEIDSANTVNSKRGVIADNSYIFMSLDTYSAVAAAKQLPATELILQVEQADFEQMLELQQQDQEFNEQSELYQQQLTEFMASYPTVVQPQQLSCGSRYCLLELDLQDAAAWPALFKALTAQQWWQSISYQSAAQNMDNSHDQQFRLTLLLQQDWVAESDQQTVAAADGEYSH
ncbi:hypothetical protein [Rheinheimera sp. SA_1]|uniref:hypothetical protein n=1 Tax=Rheinheimera sp. SA_1 TaxID=1827365 RepID=UPI000AADA916|nr:hypothetical protein [Rheinheimera sp. SA_1]